MNICFRLPNFFHPLKISNTQISNPGPAPAIQASRPSRPTVRGPPSRQGEPWWLALQMVWMIISFFYGMIISFNSLDWVLNGPALKRTGLIWAPALERFGSCCGSISYGLAVTVDRVVVPRMRSASSKSRSHNSTLTSASLPPLPLPPPPLRCCFPVFTSTYSSRSSPSLATGGRADCIWALACSPRASPCAATQLLHHCLKEL